MCVFKYHAFIYFLRPPPWYGTSTTLQCHRHIHLFLLSYVHYLLCACWHLEAMKGLSSLTSCLLLILSRPLSSLVWAQLTLLVPALGIRSPLSQNGAPIHRVRAHSLTGIWNSNPPPKKKYMAPSCAGQTQSGSPQHLHVLTIGLIRDKLDTEIGLAHWLCTVPDHLEQFTVSS